MIPISWLSSLLLGGRIPWGLRTHPQVHPSLSILLRDLAEGMHPCEHLQKVKLKGEVLCFGLELYQLFHPTKETLHT